MILYHNIYTQFVKKKLQALDHPLLDLKQCSLSSFEYCKIQILTRVISLLKKYFHLIKTNSHSLLILLSMLALRYTYVKHWLLSYVILTAYCNGSFTKKYTKFNVLLYTTVQEKIYFMNVDFSNKDQKTFKQSGFQLTINITSILVVLLLGIYLHLKLICITKYCIYNELNMFNE